MTRLEQAIPEPAAIRGDLGVVVVSLELSRSTWLVTSLALGVGEKMSRHVVPAGEAAALLRLLERLRRRRGRADRIVAIQEAGLDGFWLHRALEKHGVESHVVDAASVAVPRRRRRAKTDRIDGETLVRTLLAWRRGEPRVCAMVRPPSPEAEDRRRLSRERRTLLAERTAETNRIKGLLFAQGIFDFEPLRQGRDQRDYPRDYHRRLEPLRTGDGRELPPCLKAQIVRALERITLLSGQIAAVEGERDEMLAAAGKQAQASPAPLLLRLKGIGPELASVLWSEGLYKRFDNRRQLAAYAGLAASPWKSGKLDHEQGISKSGNPRLRTSLIQLAWLWTRHQPGSALSQWFAQRTAQACGKGRKKTMIVALARKLLVALWKYVSLGLLPEGAELKPL